MEITRDLGRIELWQESLERSLARRGKLPRTSAYFYRLQPERDLAIAALESAAYWQNRRKAAARRPGVPVPVMGLGGVSALALVAVTTFPSLFGGRARKGGLRVALTTHYRGQTYDSQSQSRLVHPYIPTVARTVAQVERAPVPRPRLVVARKPVAPIYRHQAGGITAGTKRPAPHHAAPKPAPARPAHPAKPHRSAAPKPPAHRSPSPPRSASGYVNPLAHASVTPERIDQGVDYAGTGTLTSIGRARVNYVGTSDTGWPGAFIEYQLLRGPDAGRYVYYAEGVRPASGIYVGRILQAGRRVVRLIPGWSTGIEIGWGAGIGTESYAHAHGEYTYPTRAGESFSALIASLGGPPGIP